MPNFAISDVFRVGPGRVCQAYPSDDNTAASRGIALTTGVGDATDNQAIICAPGRFTPASTLDLSIGSTGAVHLSGGGVYVTTIDGPITPGVASQISNLTIHQTALPDLTTDYL